MLASKWFLALALAAAPFAASAKELTVDQVKALQGKMKATENLSVDVTQTRASALRPGKLVKRKGTARFSKPNSFRWAFDNPTEEILFNGKDFYKYDPSTKAATHFKASGENANELSQIVDLVLNIDSLLKRYDMKKADEEGDKVTIVLAPKSDRDIKGITLVYSKKDDLVTRVDLEMASKNNFSYEFSSPKRAAIPASTYKLPAGVKVTDAN